ncbi:hypothetical protein N7532_008316 [Penicillium argentinense]|uniref:Uncharacterized protein n=1 Tax=Penicillium argentinense TaxID=1131581 RepID=A0A9W9EX76_9EURO|nr:uncharacterized protein N7532_008316 [Penicillium argentinense]KAJ5089632.1 hypothetical protein N7532_008316 [Penicillium argentinense]
MSGQYDNKSLKEKVLSILPSHGSSKAKDFDNDSAISALAVAAAGKDMPGKWMGGLDTLCFRVGWDR